VQVQLSCSRLDDRELLADGLLEKEPKRRGDFLDDPDAIANQNFLMVKLENWGIAIFAALHCEADRVVVGLVGIPEL
jgi:hypothetical protein